MLMLVTFWTLPRLAIAVDKQSQCPDDYEQMISEFEFLKTERRRSANFSDGGHWQGRGKEPDWNRSFKSASKRTHVIEFDTSDSAEAWNNDHDDATRYASYAAALGVSALTQTWVVNALSTLVMGEVLSSSIDRVYKGWKYSATTECSYSRDVWGWSGNCTSSLEVSDENDNIKYSSSAAPVQKPEITILELSCLASTTTMQKW